MGFVPVHDFTHSGPLRPFSGFGLVTEVPIGFSLTVSSGLGSKCIQYFQKYFLVAIKIDVL